MLNKKETVKKERFNSVPLCISGFPEIQTV